MQDKCEGARLGKVIPPEYRCTFDHHVEEDDRVRGLVAKRPVRGGRDCKRTRPGGVRFTAATETDDRSALSERREVELAESNEAWDIVTFINCNLNDFEGILEHVGNDKYVLREKTEVRAGTPFGVPKLDTHFKWWEWNRILKTHTVRLSLFPAHQEEHILVLASCPRKCD